MLGSILGQQEWIQSIRMKASSPFLQDIHAYNIHLQIETWLVIWAWILWKCRQALCYQNMVTDAEKPFTKHGDVNWAYNHAAVSIRTTLVWYLVSPALESHLPCYEAYGYVTLIVNKLSISVTTWHLAIVCLILWGPCFGYTDGQQVTISVNTSPMTLICSIVSTT